MTSQKKYCINCFYILPMEARICERCQFEQAQEDSPLYLTPPFRLNDQYYVGRVLGHGGFAITYLAYDRNLDQRVAIKEFFPIEHATRDPNGMSVNAFAGNSAEQFYAGKEKFIAEAKLLAHFRSPHIIKIRQFFQAFNTAYFVMEYLQGQTLSEYMQNQGGKLSMEQVKKLLFPLLDALEEVHYKQVYHRDIKPDNIYISEDGTPILLDFGAARQSFNGKTFNILTMLTPGFSPAEQYSPNGIQGPWTDIYSLAATLYFALTGVLPPTPTERMFGDDPLIPPSKLGVDISAHDEAWLLKGLEVRWSHRPDSIQAWKHLIYAFSQAHAVDIKAQSKIAEDNFLKIAVLPKLLNKKLSPKDEQEIYSSAAFMEIPKDRVHDLLEQALISMDAVRCEVEEDEIKTRELLKREEELRRKEEELRYFEALRQKEEEMWWEAELAQQDAHKQKQQEEAARQQAAAEEQARQAELLLKREEELRRKEEEFKYFEAVRQKEEAMWIEAELAHQETQKQKQAEVLRQKEEKLQRKEEELRFSVDLAQQEAYKKRQQQESLLLQQKEEELRRKEQELLQKEAALNAKLNQPVEAFIETKKSKPLDPFEIEDPDEDLSDEEVSELLKLFQKPKNKSNQTAVSAQTSELISLDQHYAQLAADMTPLPVSKSRLIPAGAVSLPERISNSLGMEFRLIYPSLSGENFVVFRDFSVGPPELGFAVLSTRPFYLQTSPVTQMQWQMLMNINPSQFEADPLLPVDQVSWDDCQLFIHRLNQFQEARYRLPAEVEWEFACRAGSTQAYFYGEDPALLAQYAWFKDNASRSLQAVGLKRPNPFGLFDMLGNVQEWTQDRFIPLDGSEVKSNQRALRGGAWDDSAQDCRSASRRAAPANCRASNIGFRLAIEVS